MRREEGMVYRAGKRRTVNLFNVYPTRSAHPLHTHQEIKRQVDFEWAMVRTCGEKTVVSSLMHRGRRIHTHTHTSRDVIQRRERHGGESVRMLIYVDDVQMCKCAQHTRPFT